MCSKWWCWYKWCLRSLLLDPLCHPSINTYRDVSKTRSSCSAWFPPKLLMSLQILPAQSSKSISPLPFLASEAGAWKKQTTSLSSRAGEEEDNKKNIYIYSNNKHWAKYTKWDIHQKTSKCLGKCTICVTLAKLSKVYTTPWKANSHLNFKPGDLVKPSQVLQGLPLNWEWQPGALIDFWDHELQFLRACASEALRVAMPKSPRRLAASCSQGTDPQGVH